MFILGAQKMFLPMPRRPKLPFSFLALPCVKPQRFENTQKWVQATTPGGAKSKTRLLEGGNGSILTSAGNRAFQYPRARFMPERTS